MKVVEVHVTPNPNARKFVLSESISAEPVSFFDAGAAVDHPLASALFAVPGVTSVLLLGDFVTVNKSPEAKWPELVAAVKKVLK